MQSLVEKYKYAYITNIYECNNLTYDLNIYIYTHIFTNAKTGRVFTTSSFIFHTRKKSFHDIVISIVQ